MLIAAGLTCLVYTILVMISFFSHKKVVMYSTKTYTGILIVTFLCLLVEIINNYVGLRYYETNPSLARGTAYVYLTVAIFAYMLMLYYFILNTQKIKKSPIEKFNKVAKTAGITILICSIILVALVILLPLEIVYDGTWYYGTGPSINVIISSVVAMFAFVGVITLVYFKKMNRKERISYIGFNAVALLGVIVRFFLPNCTMIGAFISLAAIVLYFTIENPDTNITKELETSNSVKQDFLSSMSHELKTPINIIMGLSSNPSADLQALKNDMNTINVETLALAEIFSNIIDMNTLESGVQHIEEKTYNIKDIIQPLVNEYNKRLQNKGVELKCFCDALIPKSLVGDIDKILDATRKLLSNAAKFTDKGSVTISIGGEIQKEIYNLRIEIKDTGKGIEKEQFNRIFEEFGRSTTDVNSATSGIGLGLTICKILIYSMGGKILLGSEVGIGSTFIIEVPQKIGGAITPEAQASGNLPKPPAEGSNIPPKELRALIVDDNALNLKVARKILESYGIEVTEANSGDECLQILNQGNKFNYIFMDIMMPVKDGVITMHEIRYLDLPYVPLIIALTADAAIGSKERYLKEGFDDYIAKPLTPEELSRITKRDKNK